MWEMQTKHISCTSVEDWSERCMTVGTYGDQFSMPHQKLMMVSEIDGDIRFCC